MFEFEYPLLFLLLIPAAFFIFLYFRKSELTMDRIVIGILRSIVFTLIIFALTIPSLLLPVKEKQIIFLVDQSKSFYDQTDEIYSWIDESIKNKQIEDEFAVVTFSEHPEVKQSMQSEKRLTFAEEAPKRNQETNLENSLLFAASLFEHRGGRIILFSDGNETLGNSGDAAKVLKEIGISIDVVPMEINEKEDIAITELSVPETMFEGEQGEITVRIHSNSEKHANLRISLNDVDIIQNQIQVKEGENVFTFTHPIQSTGLFVYKAELIAENDSFVENNTLYAVSQVEGVPKILVVEEEPSQYATILSNAQFDVTSISPDLLPTTLSHLLQYDSVVFNNISGTDVSGQQMTIIEQAVRDFGKGFIMMGGENSFGLGGYFKTPIENILPVDMEIKGKEQLPSLGLVIVLDRSGSMAGQKLNLAKEAAARSVELLREEDTFGFIAFDDRPWVIVETGPINDKEETIEQIRSVTSGGGTEIYSSLELAYENLADLQLQRKHIILLTDGQSATSNSYETLIEEGKNNNITLSTVAIGHDADRLLLEDLAEMGNGRFYDVFDETTIPSILSRETVMMTRTYIEDHPFYPTVYPYEPWEDIFSDGVAQMNAYIATTPKPSSKIILESEKEDPVLAEWQYGLGTTMAFTSDLSGKWSGEFPLMESWPNFLTELTTQTLPKFTNAPLTMSFREEKDQTIINLKQTTDSLFQLDVQVVSETGEPVDGSLQIVAPGEYEYSIPKNAGLYFLSASLNQDDGTTSLFQTGFSIPYSDEFLLSGLNTNLLTQLAEETGGSFLEDRKEAFRPLENKIVSKTALSHIALLLAFFILFIELVIRRLGLRFFISSIHERFKRKKSDIKHQDQTVRKLVQKGKRKRKQIESVAPEDKKVIETIAKEREKKEKRKQKKNESQQSNAKDSTRMNREEQLKRLLEAKNRKNK